MTSERQRSANQRNGKLAAGPKTSAGKLRASKNAVTHGILSRELVLPNESREEFESILGALSSELGAQGILENELVERIAIVMWRQRRLVRAEKAEIEMRQSGESMAGSARQIDPAVMMDAVLFARALKREPYASHLDEFEKELRLLHLAADMSFARFAGAFPLVSRAYPEPEPSMLDRERPSVGAVYGDLTEIAKPWLLAIAEARQSASIADLQNDAMGIPAAPDVIARYQSPLDNEWYKAMRAFREAKRDRMNTIEVVAGTS